MQQNKINHSDMVRQLRKSGTSIIQDLTPNSAYILHMAVGIAGESGELLSAIYNHDEYGDVDLVNILEELGDAEFYIEGYRQEMGFTRQQTLSTFIEFDDIDKEYSDATDAAIKFSIYAADLLEYSKKFAVYVKPIDSKSVLTTLIKIEFELDRLRQCFDFDHEAILDANIEKLSVRYKGHNYSNDQAKDRADKKED